MSEKQLEANTKSETNCETRPDECHYERCGCTSSFGDGLVIAGRDSFVVCKTHRLFWYLGHDIFSSWMADATELGIDAAQRNWDQQYRHLTQNYTKGSPTAPIASLAINDDSSENLSLKL